MVQVPPELSETPLRIRQRGARAFFLGGHLFLRDAVPLQHRPRLGFGFPQRRQPGRKFRGASAGRQGRLGCRADRLPSSLQRRLGLGACGFRPSPLNRQQLGFRLADRPRDVPVPAGLARLPLQPGKLRFQLPAQVFGTRQVRLRGPQLQLRLVPAGVQAGDPRRFLQHRPAVFGFGTDQRADATLTDHRRSPRARRQVGEQRLHVTRPHVPPVDPIGAAGPALDAADDLQFRLLVERRRRGAFGLVQRQRDLGDVAGRPAGGTGEDHVLHLTAAQAAGARLAHRPAQGFDDVGFAAAVRADDAGQAGIDLDRGRLGEAFESGDAKAGEADRQDWLRVRTCPAAA